MLASSKRADSVRPLPASKSDCGCGRRISIICLLLAFLFGRNAPAALATKTRQAIAVKEAVKAEVNQVSSDCQAHHLPPTAWRADDPSTASPLTARHRSPFPPASTPVPSPLSPSQLTQKDSRKENPRYWLECRPISTPSDPVIDLAMVGIYACMCF